VTESIVDVAGTINEVPTVAAWVKTEMVTPKSRRMWTDVGINLFLTLGFGYIAFYLVRLALGRPRRAVASRETPNIFARLLGLFFLLIIEILPILAYGIAAYLTLGVVSPREKTRLVALAWVNGFIISHTIIALSHLLFVPQIPALRLLKLTDESANYLIIWVKRLTYTVIYGYFALQAALLLGLPTAPYDALLRLLGLMVTMLIIVMIMQNRETIAGYVAQLTLEKNKNTDEVQEPATPQGFSGKIQAQGILARVAAIWHLLATLYVILLYGVWALRIPGGFFFLFKATSLTIVTLVVMRVLFSLLSALFNRGFRIGDELKQQLPGLEKRANQYISTLHKALRIGCYLFGVIVIMQAWGINTFGWLTSEPGKIIGSTIGSVTGILLITFIIWEVANSLIESNLTPRASANGVEINARTVTLLTVARKALAIVLTVVSALMVLSQLGLNIAPLLAGAGVLGLAIGFGSQKLVQDVITGIFILLEDQMAVGDVVDLGGLAGVVEAVSIRTVKLRDVSGTVHTIPFSAISTVSNKTKDYSYYVMDIGIGYRENVDEVMETLRTIGADLQKDLEYGPKILEPLDILGVDAFANSAVVIKARIKTIPTKQWWVGREFNRRMKYKFDELDIEIPFPHQTIFFGVDKNGNSPAGRLTIQAEKDGATS
jgi:small conductance mechanosensitive channel